MKKPIIGITMGDPAGIGPEICVKALSDKEIVSVCRPIIIGDSRFIELGLDICGAELEIKTISKVEEADFKPGIINILDLKNADPEKIKLGKISATAGKAGVEYLIEAIKLAMSKKIDAIATAPLHKEAMHLAGYKFDGHTEVLAKYTKTNNYGMMFISDSFWLMLATTHIPLSKVSKSITKERVYKTIRLAHDTLKKLKRKKIRIGVAGLNPHAGEGGIFGNEEIKAIAPAISQAKKDGIDVEGPISPDAIFNLAKGGMFDLVVAMYHDQGLIPMKLLSFNKSVNVTVGLPIIRTSVDHGTGFNIAGKGFAHPGSLIKAIEVAAFFAKTIS